MSLMREAERPEHMNPRELYIGVDVHEKESQVAVYDPDGTLIEEKRLPTEKLPAFIASLPGEKHVALEAIGFIYPIHDALAEVGCDVAVANPQNIQLIARTRIKHDKVDARVLGELLRTNFFPPVSHTRRGDEGETPPGEGPGEVRRQEGGPEEHGQMAAEEARINRKEPLQRGRQGSAQVAGPTRGGDPA